MKSVLVVDDAAFMRMAIKTALKKDKFNVIAEAEDGSMAVEKYINLSPDIVTMDIVMPKMSGLEALRRIIQYDPDARVVMVSAMGQEIMVRKAIMLGAKSFIVKPFQDDHVIKSLNHVLHL